MEKLLPAIEIDTGPDPDSAVILLHGLGADGNDFAPIIPEMRLPTTMATRFIFPHAPRIPVTINGGFVMPAWYDILEMQIDRRVDTGQLLASAAALSALVEREIGRGIAARRIVVAGFSQGGAVAYHYALSAEQPLAGLLVMSSYFATWDSISLNAAGRSMPIEIHHGAADPVVPEALGRKAVELLTQRGYKPNYRVYPMEHAVCGPQLADISQWLQQVLERS